MDKFDVLGGNGEKQKLLQALGQPEYVNSLFGCIDSYIDVAITSAQMLTLNTVPVSLVSAPGAGLVLVPTRIFASMVYNSTTYACNASGASVKYTDGSGVAPGLTLTQAFIQSASSSSLLVQASATAYIPTANKPLVLVAASTDPTTGNSAMNVRIYYRVIASPLV